ncbi:hypothetical protein ABZ891_38820, partial [Streptomyces sp. NPDC047023]
MTQPATTSHGRVRTSGRATAIHPQTQAQRRTSPARSAAPGAPAVRRGDIDAGRWPDVARTPPAGPA